MLILVTGAHGFIGKNLIIQLAEMNFSILSFGRNDDPSTLPQLIEQADALVHLAAENRPRDEADFELVNFGLTQNLCDIIRGSRKQIPIIFASSIHAANGSQYGLSKLKAEEALQKLSQEVDVPLYIYRLPNIFGKWCKPNYNSVVATFCYNIAHGLPITIDEETAQLSLTHVDDLVSEFVRILNSKHLPGPQFLSVSPIYSVTLKELAEQIRAFEKSRKTLVIEDVGLGLPRALYATYLSYLDTSQFSYTIPVYADKRGVFVEMLKTSSSGQFSFFTIVPGVTRGQHYHHSKSEKFFVVEGHARFRFRNIITDQFLELYASGDKVTVVESIPGWSHNVTNVGESKLICMVWANEMFDRDKPDTIALPVVAEE